MGIDCATFEPVLAAIVHQILNAIRSGKKKKNSWRFGCEIVTGLNGQLTFKPKAIFVGEGYKQKEYKRSMELAKVIVKALNDYEEKNENDFAQSLRENDSGHQPC